MRMTAVTARRTRGLACVCLATVLAFGAPSLAADLPPDQNWGQWRGPLATGAAPAGANPPMTWAETRNVRWKVLVPGEGSSTPIVWGDKVFVQTAINLGKKPAAASAAASHDVTEPAPQSQDPQQQPPPPRRGRGGRGGFGGSAKPIETFQFALLCFDRKTGKLLWQQVAREEVPHEGHHPSQGAYASQSPVTDGQHVWAYFGSQGVYCYDFDGHQVWSRDLGRMRILLGFGEGSSAALWGDKLIVNWDNEDESFITALDKNTGKTLWKTPRDEKTSWATPLVVEHAGKTQVITAATSKVRGYDLETGKLIWEAKGLTRNVIPTPVSADGIVYLTSGYQGNALIAIRLGATGDLTKTDSILWTYGKKTPYVPSPLLYEGRIYLFSGNTEILSCFEAKTGKPLIDAKRVEGLVEAYASPVAAAGRVYLTGRNGATVVIKSSDQFEPIATNTLDDKFDGSPAIAGNELFLRGNKSLYCIAEK